MSSETSNMIRWNVHLPRQLIEKLKDHAAHRGTPAAEVVRRALEEFLKEQR